MTLEYSDFNETSCAQEETTTQKYYHHLQSENTSTKCLDNMTCGYIPEYNDLLVKNKLDIQRKKQEEEKARKKYSKEFSNFVGCESSIFEGIDKLKGRIESKFERDMEEFNNMFGSFVEKRNEFSEKSIKRLTDIKKELDKALTIKSTLADAMKNIDIYDDKNGFPKNDMKNAESGSWGFQLCDIIDNRIRVLEAEIDDKKPWVRLLVQDREKSRPLTATERTEMGWIIQPSEEELREAAIKASNSFDNSVDKSMNAKWIV